PPPDCTKDEISTGGGPVAFASRSGETAMERALFVMPLFRAVRTKESQQGIIGVIPDGRARPSDGLYAISDDDRRALSAGYTDIERPEETPCPSPSTAPSSS